MLIDITGPVADRLKSAHLYLPVGQHRINDEVTVESPLSLGADFDLLGAASIGAFTYSWSRITASVACIGRYCSIASGVEFGAHEHETQWLSTSSFTYDPAFIWGRFGEGRHHRFQPRDLPKTAKRDGIIIGNDVWIGAQAYIRGGVIIGDGAVIGTNAVVTRDVPPYAVVVGNPGRIIKYRFPPETIARLLALEWWRFLYLDFDFDITDIQTALTRLEEQIEAGDLLPYAPTPLRLCDLDIPRILPQGFDVGRYRALNPDLSGSEDDLINHYMAFGWKEKRLWV